MSVVDVSRIPNNNKFDPVREAILQLEGIIESETAGVFSINGEQGSLTLQAGTNITITSPSDGVIEIASSAGSGGIAGSLTLAAGDGIALSSPTVFDGTTDLTVTITNDDRPNAGVLTLVAGSGISTVGAADWEDEPQTWGQQGRIWSVSEGNTFSANEISDKSITLTHGDTSSATSSSNTNGVVIQGLGIDEFGHTQSISTTNLDDRYLQLVNANVDNWDEAYSWGDHALAGYITSFTETDPTVGAHIKAITTTNISNWNTAYGWGDHALEGYLTSFTETDPTVPSHVKTITTTNISNWNTAYGWGDHAAEGYLTSFTESDPTVPSHVKAITTTNIANWNDAYNDQITGATFNTSTGVITLSQQDGGTITVDIDGRFLTSFTESDPTVPAHVKSITTTNISNWNDAYNDQIVSSSFNTSTGVLTLSQQDGGSISVDLDGRYLTTAGSNNYVSAVSFNTGNGVLTLDRVGLSSLTVDLDGRYLGATSTAANANLLDNLDSSYFLNYNNLNNKPTIPNSFSNIAVSGQSTVVADSTSDTLTLAAGAGIAITTNSSTDTITITNTGGSGGGGELNQNAFSFVAVSGQSTVSADNTTDTLTLVAGTGISLTTNATNDSVTITNIGGGGATPTLDEVTTAGNISSSQVSIFKSIAPSYPLDVGGTIRAQGDVIAFSDERVKENIVTIDGALDKVLSLRGVEYNKINESKKSIGVIAQEVEKIIPQVVSDDEEGMKSVAYGNMVGLLIEAIKEQQQQIDELKAIINGGTK